MLRKALIVISLTLMTGMLFLYDSAHTHSRRTGANVGIGYWAYTTDWVRIHKVAAVYCLRLWTTKLVLAVCSTKRRCEYLSTVSDSHI